MGTHFATIGEGMACESGDSRRRLSKILGHMSEIQLDLLMLPCFGM